MREVNLLDADQQIFGATLNRTLYICYRNNIKLFNVMLVDQGTGYWIKFCCTLKSVLEKEGYNVKVIKKKENHFDGFFINLLEVLTHSEHKKIQILINDVVSMGRFCQLFIGAKIFESYNDKESPSFKRLFKPDNSNPDIKLWLTLPLYLRAVGSLLKVFELWLSAFPTNIIKWKYPEPKVNLMNEPSYGLFEHYLKETYGDKLLTLLGPEIKNVRWWSDTNIATVEEGKPDLVCKKRLSYLGKTITEMIQDNNDAYSMVVGLRFFDGVSLKNFHSYYILRNCLRGAYLFLRNEHYRNAFLVANSRELYLVSCAAIFHPCSQFAVGFWHSAFGPHFWSANNGAEDTVKDLIKSHDVFNMLQKPLEVSKHSSLQIGPIGLAMVTMYEAKMAVYLDSQFHDTIAISTTWQSPEVLIRLMWNMPLCLNWLETVLLQIYEFETVFLPFIHFPLSKEVKSLAEELYVKYCRQARFLVKAAIIIADYIYFNEAESAGKCYEERMGLKFAIQSLVPIMCFLNGPVYQVLEVVLRESCDFERMSNGQIRHKNVDRTYIDLCSAYTIPNLDKIFSQNHRSIFYWLSKEKYPPFEEISTQCSYVLKALQIFEKYLKDKDNVKLDFDMMCEPLLSYDKEMCKRIGVEVFTFKEARTLDRTLCFVYSIFDILNDDGWLDHGDRWKFWRASFGHFVDIEEILENVTCLNEEAMKVIYELEYLGEVYLFGACLLGDTWDVELPDQNLLAKLFIAECRSAMADAATRFAVVASRYYSAHYPCPQQRYFVEMRNKMKSFKLESITLEEAKNKLKVGFSCNYTSDLPDLIVSNMKTTSGDDMQPYYDFLKNLDGLRIRLLHEISEKQWINSEQYSVKKGPMNNILFCNMSLLEYRLVEEMAALRKSAGLGYKDIADKLSELLRLRAMTLIKQYKMWFKGEISPVPLMIPMSPAEVLQVCVVNRVRTTALLIPLRSIFTVYLSDLSTVHPMCESTIYILVEWQDFILKLKRPDSDILIAENTTEFCEAVRYMGLEYMNGLLDHCIEAWNVPKLCSNPTTDVEKYSPQHAQKIYSCLLHMSLICAYNALLATDTRPMALEYLRNMEKQFITCEVLIREELLPFCSNWNESCAALQKNFRSIYKRLMFTIKSLKQKADKIPHWRGYDDVFFLMFMDLTEADGINPLDILNMNDFLNKDFGVQLKSTNIDKLKVPYKNKEAETSNERMKLTEKKPIEKCETKGNVIVIEKTDSTVSGVIKRASFNMKEATKFDHVEVKKIGDVSIVKYGNADVVEKTVPCCRKFVEDSDENTNSKAIVEEFSEIDEISEISKEEKNKTKRRMKRERYKLNKQKHSIDKLTQNSKQIMNTVKDGSSDSSPAESVKDEPLGKVKLDKTCNESATEKQKPADGKVKQSQNIKKQESKESSKESKESSKESKETSNSTLQKTEGNAEKDEKPKGNTVGKGVEEKSIATGNEKVIKCCFECGAVEKVHCSYKKCSICTHRKWTLVRYYCSPECQGKAWKERHCAEHKNREDPTDTEPQKE